jgi:hypothetical protein
MFRILSLCPWPLSLLLFLFFSLLSFSVNAEESAASFQGRASKATLPYLDCEEIARRLFHLEQIICRDAKLSALDHELVRTYHEMLKSDIQNEWQENSGMRVWLELFRSTVGPYVFVSGKFSNSRLQQFSAALGMAYQDRIDALRSMPISSSAMSKGERFQINDISDSYDFTLHLLVPCSFTYLDDVRMGSYCDEPGQLLIFKKGQSEIMQVINRFFHVSPTKSDEFPQVAESMIHEDSAGKATISLGYGDRDNGVAIKMIDINFDGYDDMILAHVRENNSYNPFDVYLFKPEHQRFVHSSEISNLTDIFPLEIDTERKRLRKYVSGESCSTANYSEVTEWKIVNNLPIVVFRQMSDLDFCENGKDSCIKTTEERLVDDKLQSTVSYELYDMSDGDMEEDVEFPASTDETQ